jgi:hypothetical protein
MLGGLGGAGFAFSGGKAGACGRVDLASKYGPRMTKAGRKAEVWLHSQSLRLAT